LDDATVRPIARRGCALAHLEERRLPHALEGHRPARCIGLLAIKVGVFVVVFVGLLWTLGRWLHLSVTVRTPGFDGGKPMSARLSILLPHRFRG
jgi:hypothetical protein